MNFPSVFMADHIHSPSFPIEQVCFPLKPQTQPLPSISLMLQA